ncbi:MAG TPA: zinc ribbon domain-containing protein [Candidatus Ozemobacteraceae bacterium]|nr:zinc ribbon domain-containing protein [Candidatus Ozemobacteraceae bacterium]HQG27234.1 zinc ribbon domain-containing protein [Candidatus Ozemobacteraceae bacterium]
MKRYVLMLTLMLAASPVWALFCQYCGSSMADDARFCPKCGRQHAAPSSNPAPQPATPAPVTVTPDNPATPIAAPAELPSAPYEAINRYESLLTSSAQAWSSGTAAEQRFRITSALQQAGSEAPRFTPAMQRLHNLYTSKYDILSRYDSACARSARGPGRIEADAEKEKLLFTLARTNEMISYLKDRLSDPAAPARVDEMQKSLDEAVREHRVTAPYLRLDGYRVKQGQRLWVMDIVDERVMVMILDDCGARKPLVGWLSLGDLERRSTYRRPASWVAPVQRVEKEVVIVGHTWWWPGWPHPRHPRYPDRDRDHDRHDRHDRDRRHRH